MVKFLAPWWDDVYELTLKVAEKIMKSGFSPDILVGIARGGWIVARLLSDFLDNSNVTSIRIEFYKGIAETGEKPQITQPLIVDVKDKNVLICDDVADTGHSLIAAVEHIKEKGAKEVKVATLHLKPWSSYKPDYFVVETDAWIIYPWEIRETISKLVSKLKSEGKSLEEIKKELLKTGIKNTLIDYFLKLEI
ncbi:MAG: phosphoribosyltransferase [Candidatus Baldrarchaeia archaeon]